MGRDMDYTVRDYLLALALLVQAGVMLNSLLNT
jgi:hypothetical protein